MEQRQILLPGRSDFSFLTADFVTARLSGTGADPARARGDHDLDPHPRRDATKALTPASVLVPLIIRETGLTVLLTERTQHLTDHAGQISFPGGRREPGDADAVETALRETEEEIGLPRARVQVIGGLDTYVTGTGYSITPIVGLISPPFPLRPDPFEVADVFEVPLGFIADPAHHHRQSRVFEGRTRHYWVIPYEQRHIWGATAGMLVNLARLLVPDPA
jgi:8-oxo-dGTP pyrophosphatase MutT (NUDIX family)